MRLFDRPVRVVAALALCFAVAGCESLSNFDMDNLDVLGLQTKKPLPGERRAVFPEGVPGIPQGIPPEMRKGYQDAAAAGQAEQQAVAPAQETKPRAKPQSRPRTTARAPARPAPQAQPQQDPDVWPPPPQQGRGTGNAPASETQNPNIWPDPSSR